MLYRRRRRVRRPRRVKRRVGGSFFGSIGNAISKASGWLRGNKLISTVGKALGSVGVPYASTIGNVAEKFGYGRRRRRVRRPRVRRVYRKVGGVRRRRVGRPRVRRVYRKVGGVRRRRVGRPRVRRVGGVRRRRVRRRRGGSLRSIASSVHRFVRDKKLISGALDHFGHPKFASAARSFGYGRRRTRRVGRRMGGANYFSTEQIALPRF